MENFRKEIPKFIITIMLSLGIFHLFFGWESLTEHYTSINIHDTYYVVNSIVVLIFITGFVFYPVYLLRMIFNRFKNHAVNCIFLFSGMFVLAVLPYLIISVYPLAVFKGMQVSGKLITENNRYANWYFILFYSLFAVIMIQTFAAVLTGIQYKSKCNALK